MVASSYLYWFNINLIQVIRIIPYSAVQLCSYEIYKVILELNLHSKLFISFLSWLMYVILWDLQILFRGKDDELSVLGRLAAGACAGMTSTLVSVSISDLLFVFSLL